MVLPLRSTYPAVTCSWSRVARARVISTSGSTSSSDWPEGQRGRRVVNRRDLRAQPRRHDLVEFGQRPQRGLTDACHAAARGNPQADGHGDGLLGVEQQRRQGRARAQLVAAAVALAGVHGIAEVAQAFDVAAHASPRHAEPFGEFFAAPHPARLQQAEKLQHPAGRFGHATSLPHS